MRFGLVVSSSSGFRPRLGVVGWRVFTADGITGAAQVEIGSEWIEPLPSSGIFGYSSPAVSKNPKSVKFGFEGINRSVLCQFSTNLDFIPKR